MSVQHIGKQDDDVRDQVLDLKEQLRRNVNLLSQSGIVPRHNKSKS